MNITIKVQMYRQMGIAILIEWAQEGLFPVGLSQLRKGEMIKAAWVVYVNIHEVAYNIIEHACFVLILVL